MRRRSARTSRPVPSPSSSKVRFSDHAIARLRVSFVEMGCWRCHRRGHIYYAQQLSRCGHEIGFALTSEPRDTGVDPLDPEVLAVVRDWLAGIRCAATRGTDARSLGCATDLAHPGLEACSGWQRRMTADD